MCVWYALNPKGQKLAECEAPGVREATIVFLTQGVPDVAKVQSRIAWEMDREEEAIHRRNRRNKFPEEAEESDT
jgi:hypothetical protein